jgi:hypothetical protein
MSSQTIPNGEIHSGIGDPLRQIARLGVGLSNLPVGISLLFEERPRERDL